MGVCSQSYTAPNYCRFLSGLVCLLDLFRPIENIAEWYLEIHRWEWANNDHHTGACRHNFRGHLVTENRGQVEINGSNVWYWSEIRNEISSISCTARKRTHSKVLDFFIKKTTDNIKASGGLDFSFEICSILAHMCSSQMPSLNYARKSGI